MNLLFLINAEHNRNLMRAGHALNKQCGRVKMKFERVSGAVRRVSKNNYNSKQLAFRLKFVIFQFSRILAKLYIYIYIC